MRRLPLAAIAVALIATGCGGSSSPTAATPVVRTSPNIAGFLKLPVATPSRCPSTANGTTVGRDSPWVGHVDVSIFLKPSTSTQQLLRFGSDLRADPLASHVYFESSREAYLEFQRLYTCWASVRRAQTPASYRIVLVPTASIASRDILVARLVRRHDVDSVSCDPSVPCVDVVRSPMPRPTPTATSHQTD
jgi:FtsX extracellular domain